MIVVSLCDADGRVQIGRLVLSTTCDGPTGWKTDCGVTKCFKLIISKFEVGLGEKYPYVGEVPTVL